MILKTLPLAAAMLIAAPASASTLVLFDFNGAEGERVASSPYADQELQRMTRQGLVRAISVPVDDQGGRRTSVLDIQSPVTMPPLGVGVRILTGSVQWQVTTERVGSQLNYEINIRTQQGFSNGIGTPTRVTNGGADLVGVASMEINGRPAIARRYASPGGSRMMIGVIQP